MEEFIANLRVISHISSDYYRKLKCFKALMSKSDLSLGYYNDGKNNIDLEVVAYAVFVDSLILQYNRFEEIYDQIIKNVAVEQDIKERIKRVKRDDKFLFKTIATKYPDLKNYRNNISAHIYKKNSSSLLLDGVKTEFIIPTKISDFEFIWGIILELTQNIFKEFNELIGNVNNHKINDNITYI